ncbi:alpha-amylase [Penicillium macrosclerotiorum]|uniref:alpha-amylase n=1 Tax=Penicillium macrosclerotiorum TaxID=303699 RepID=UPI002548AFCF|nr:alpha-amylase [Penicillium macrosclerotiorum]KAJ5679310.1 alpha-amylase [Penicillium macrosclerotiorum]
MGQFSKFGFTIPSAKPWMTINKDYTEWNVANKLDDSESILNYWKEMLALRKQYSDLFVYGSYTSLEESRSGEMVLEYEHEYNQAHQTAAVLLNLSDQMQTVSMEKYQGYSILITNQRNVGRTQGQFELQPYGAVVFLKA